MGLLSKLFNLGEAGVNKIEEAIDDKWGVEIHEANIAKARKRLVEAQDKVDSAEARATVQKKISKNMKRRLPSMKITWLK